jgi:hypothetical protein
MPGLSVAELMVAAGEIVAAAPPGTPNVALATTPVAPPWVDLGYVNEDGVTLTDSPSETNVPAWQSPTPVLVLTTEVSRTFAFNLMQWNPDTLAFAIGGGMITPAPAEGESFAPDARGAYAWLARWRDGDGNVWQAYSPRGKVTGDVSAQLTRTAVGVFAATFTATPEGTEDAWHLTSDAPAWSGALMALTAEGKLEQRAAPKSGNGGGK